MPPYKDKEKEKIARKASISRRILDRVLIEFRVGDEDLLNALQTASNGINRNAFIKDILRQYFEQNKTNIKE